MLIKCIIELVEEIEGADKLIETLLVKDLLKISNDIWYNPNSTQKEKDKNGYNMLSLDQACSDFVVKSIRRNANKDSGQKKSIRAKTNK
ncbi:MAG: hypothetical protein ISN64_03185 [Rickettsia sp.]|nr:hypothetical protein [Rickettsia sp.]